MADRYADYQILEGDDPDFLREQVLEEMAQGWLPQGGPFTAPWQAKSSYSIAPDEEFRVIFFQAMVHPFSPDARELRAADQVDDAGVLVAGRVVEVVAERLAAQEKERGHG